MKFSLIYPTRHRPRFIEMALNFLEHQNYDDFEVIVADNYTDPSMSCEVYCQRSSLRNIKYVRPQSPLGMVDNWNYALQFATGDYVCYFTDKMFLLPGTLAYSAKILQEKPADIVNWVDSKYSPVAFSDYFGEGWYVNGITGVAKKKSFEEYCPKDELRKKAFASVSRSQQDSSHYVRGKICFGAYHKKLVERILERTEALFCNISPDYTSMILGLSYASSALEINRPGIVHINTDLSNGGQGAIRDDQAYAFLASLNEGERLFGELLIPNLYSSAHNVVAYDYVSLLRRFNLDYELNLVNWLVYIAEDLDSPMRVWSSPEIEIGQRQLLDSFIKQNLSSAAREDYYSKLQQRANCAGEQARRSEVRKLIRIIAPSILLELRRKYMTSGCHHLDKLRDVLRLNMY